jgi:hypothetical protein
MSRSVFTSGHNGVRAATSALVLALASCLAGQAAEGDIWTLQDVTFSTANTGLYSSAAIISQHADSRGGLIEFNLGGEDGLHTCPGGTETIRFSWDFTSDVSRLLEGADVTLGVHGEFLHVDPPCTGHIAAMSRVSAVGSKGAAAGLAEERLEVIDSDRFFTNPDTIAMRFAFGSDGEGGITNTMRSIRLDVYDPPADRPYAYFMVQFGLFGAGGMQVAYIYKRGTDTPMQPAVLTFEPNFDRPGSDYRDFDLPQDNYALCRDACAAENMCMAYTYVRPGVQGDAPRCWLKSSIPPGYASECCASGARR